VDLKTLTEDQLADLAGDVIREADRRADDLPKGERRRKIRRALLNAHKALDTAREVISGEGIIQPFSGGDPKP